MVRISLPDRGGDKDFEFDRLFSTKDGQEAVFDEVGAGGGVDGRAMMACVQNSL